MSREGTGTSGEKKEGFLTSRTPFGMTCIGNGSGLEVAPGDCFAGGIAFQDEVEGEHYV
jgi:hypothetical protein